MVHAKIIIILLKDIKNASFIIIFSEKKDAKHKAGSINYVMY